MESNRLANDASDLLSLAEDIANALGENEPELDISADEEARLRAAIAAAQYARQAYLALHAAAKNSAAAAAFVDQAKERSDRALERLRQRIRASIAVMCQLVNDTDLTDVATYVLSASA